MFKHYTTVESEMIQNQFKLILGISQDMYLEYAPDLELIYSRNDISVKELADNHNWIMRP